MGTLSVAVKFQPRGSLVVPSPSGEQPGGGAPGLRGSQTGGRRPLGTRPGPALRWSARGSAAAPRAPRRPPCAPGPHGRPRPGTPRRGEGRAGGTPRPSRWSRARRGVRGARSFPNGWPGAGRPRPRPRPQPRPPAVPSPSQPCALSAPSRFPREKHGREQRGGARLRARRRGKCKLPISGLSRALPALSPPLPPWHPPFRLNA